MIKVLHVIGLLNGWALQKRAEALIRFMSDKVKGSLISHVQFRECSADGFDFVHVHGLQVAALKRDVLSKVKMPWGFEVISERSLARLRTSQALLKRASCCWCKNVELIEKIREHVNVEPLFVPNGVDLHLFQPRQIKVGWVGNERDYSLPYKGVPLIREAVGLLNKRYKSRFVFVTSPAKYPKIITHLEMAKHYRKLDVFVCASEAEGCSNVVNEALACGVPVVSTRVGIAPELESGGLICVDRDSRSIAEGIEQMVDAKLSARRLMEQYGWDGSKVKGVYLESYREAISHYVNH